MNVSFQLNKPVVDTYDFIEIVAAVEHPAFHNPFTEAELFGVFGENKEPFVFTHGLPGGKLGTAMNRNELVPVDGFCDSEDGSLFRIRFMPRREGVHTYRVTLRIGNESYASEGTFEARDAGRKGILRVDPEHPFHFQWENTGEHFFYNGMTAYHLLGIKEEDEIRRSIDRLDRHKVNRLRIAVQSSRVRDGMAWFEPVYESDSFTYLFGPWRAERPDDYENPGWDVTRFDLGYWSKLERVLAYTREKDMSISLIMYLDAYRQGCDPFGPGMFGGQDEQRYFRYAAARLAAYSNITWDLTNEYRLIRPHEWVERMGYYLKSCDPYRHLTTCHGHGTFEFRLSGWADFAIYQSWDENGGYDYMLRNRGEQLATGRSIPQVNEEYGYEDHYPTAWGEGKSAPARSADRLRRTAWEIAMAGGYQTSGEYAGNGLGGWLNGRGDDTMRLPEAIAPLVLFFESLEWWKMMPDSSFISVGEGYGLSERGRQYAVYVPEGGDSAADIQLTLSPGRYEVALYDPATGQFGDTEMTESDSGSLTLAVPPGKQDSVYRIVRK